MPIRTLTALPRLLCAGLFLSSSTLVLAQAPGPDARATAGYVPGVPRLGIPPLLETDASLGVTNPLQLRKDDQSTAIPSGLNLASSFNPVAASPNQTQHRCSPLVMA